MYIVRNIEMQNMVLLHKPSVLSIFCLHKLAQSVFHHYAVCMKFSYIPKFEPIYFLRILKKNNYKVKKSVLSYLILNLLSLLQCIYSSLSHIKILIHYVPLVKYTYIVILKYFLP